MREGATENEKRDSWGETTSWVASLQRACVKLFNCIFFAITFKTINSHTHTQSDGGVRRLIVRMRNVLGSAESSANHRQHQQHLPRGDASTSNDGAKALTRLPHTLTHTHTRTQ